MFIYVYALYVCLHTFLIVIQGKDSWGTDFSSLAAFRSLPSIDFLAPLVKKPPLFTSQGRHGPKPIRSEPLPFISLLKTLVVSDNILN